jgi:hypothetical protein
MRWRLASCLGAIMATRAGSRYLAMVHTDRGPRCRHMATVAAVGRCDVGSGFTRCLGAIMATHTCTDRANMRERSGRPSC